MSIHQHGTIEDTLYFWFGSNDTAGSGDDGAAAAADVRLAGAGAAVAPVLSPAPTLLTHVNYPDGSYEVAVAATVANGFAATNTYAVFASLTVDGQTPTGFIGSFTLDPIIANIVEISDDAPAAVNLEAAYDGGAYNVGGGSIVAASVTGAVGSVTGAVGSVTGAVGSVTGNVGGNVVGTVASVVGAVGSVTGAVGSVTGAVGSVTGNVGGNVAGTVASVVGNVGGDVVGDVQGNVTGSVGSVVGDTAQTGDNFTRLGAPAGASVSADIAAINALVAALNNISAADVNAQMLDVLTVDTFAEPPQEAPTATTTLEDKISYLFKAFRNRITQDATTLEIYNDAGAVVDRKATVSDVAGVFTRGEIVSGP